jgi:hypothetical protein
MTASGPLLKLVHTFKQNLAGGGFEALAAGAGDSLIVDDFAAGSQAHLLEAWGADSANAADFGLRSPNFHDNTRGLRVAYQPKPAAGNVQFFLPGNVKQQLYKADALVAEVSGTATNNVGFDWLAYFDQATGAAQRLVSWAEIQASIIDTVGIFVNPTAGAAGDWGAARLLNADDDRLIADHSYALLGASSQIACEALAITGPETSNRKIGLPLTVNTHVSSTFFADLAAKYQLPLIPVFAANNKGNITVQAADVAGATVPHVTLLFADLGAT